MKKIRYAYSRKQSWTKLVEKLIVGVGYYKITPDNFFEIKDMLLETETDKLAHELKQDRGDDSGRYEGGNND